MIETSAINQQAVEAQKGNSITDFEIPAFGPAYSSLVAPLIAIAYTLFDSIKTQITGNAELAIGLDKEVTQFADVKKEQVAGLEKQLLALYANMPKRSDYKDNNTGKTAYHAALSAQQTRIQSKQTEIQKVKSTDDAATSETQSLSGDTDRKSVV